MSILIAHADARWIPLNDETIQYVVTSPPPASSRAVAMLAEQPKALAVGDTPKGMLGALASVLCSAEIR